MPFLSSSKTSSFYQRLGQFKAEPVLLLHGIGTDHQMWHPQMETWPQQGLQLVVPDLWGHGQSSDLPKADLACWHQQLDELLDECQLDQVNLVGVSMGGVIALSYVLARPQRVKRLVVSDTFAELSTVQEKILGFSQILGFHLFKVLGKQMLSKAMKSVYKANHAAVARAYFEKVSLSARLDQLILARQAINKIDVLSDLQQLHKPALVMVGEELGSMLIESNRKIAQAIPDAEFQVLPLARDPSNLVNPQAFDRAVLGFLGV